MTNAEFLLLDELYFITAYSDLLRRIDLNENEIRKVLFDLFEKKWIRIFSDIHTEISPNHNEFLKNYHQYYYFASKEGLLAHNIK